MTLREGLYLTIAAVSVLSFVALLVHYFFFRRYTRERFAFRTFFALLSLSITFLTMLVMGNSFIEFVIAHLLRLFGIADVEFSVGLSDKILGLIVVVFLGIVALKMHKNWKGEISFSFR